MESSDSDIEIVPNSIDEGRSLASHASSSSSIDSDASLPSLSKKRASQRSSRLSISSRSTASRLASTSTSSAVPTTSKLLDAGSSSDIELIAGPSRSRGAGTDLTNRIQSNSSRKPLTASSKGSTGIGGFKSAAAILKDEARKERAAAAARSRSSSASSDATTSMNKAVSRKPSPYFPSEPDIKGKKREDSLPPPLLPVSSKQHEDTRQLEDEDDDFTELPPPLQKQDMKSVSPVKALLIEEEHERQHSESPGTAFRNTLSKFKAPSIPSASTSTAARPAGSLFTGRTNKPNKASNITISSDSSFASTSASTSSTTRRARSIFTSSENGTSGTINQLQIPTPFLAVITKCPTCNDVWTVAKDTKSKLNHIRKCALQKSISNEEVDVLIEDQVRSLYSSAQQKNKIHHDNRTLLEGLLSKKGKEVQVVGVEKKKKQQLPNPNVDDKDEGGSASHNDSLVEDDSLESNHTRPFVLATQGGSTYSQATSTQVQKELNKRIKTNQRIERGDVLNVLPSAQDYVSDRVSPSISDGSANEDSTTSSKPAGQKSILAEAASKGRKKKGTANTSGVGSKNWLKAAQLLKAKETEAIAAEESEASSLLSPAHIGVSISSSLESETSKGKQRASSHNNSNSAYKTGLQSYSDSKYRLAERAKVIAALRTKQSDSSADSDNNIEAKGDIDMITSEEDSQNYLMQRPYRNPPDLELCLLDRAIRRGSEKRKQGYDAWALAGSYEDTVKDRCVDEHADSDLSKSPTTIITSSSRVSTRALSISESSASDNEPQSNRPPSLATSSNTSTRTLNALPCQSSSPPLDIPLVAATPPSSPPIGKLSLSSTPSSPVANLPSLQCDGSREHDSAAFNYCLLKTVAADSGINTVISSVSSVLPVNSLLASTPTTALSGTAPTDSSSGLFKSSAALQALTQRLKATSSSSTNPVLARRAARMAASSAILTNPPPTGTVTSASHTMYRSYSIATNSGKDGPPSGGREEVQDVYEMLVSSQENELLPETVQAKTEVELPKKQRGRPRKVSPVSLGGANKASPKRKKKDDLQSNTSETDSASAAKAKQGTLAFKAAKKGKSASISTGKKVIEPNALSPKKKKVTALNSDSSIPLTELYPGIPDYESWSKEKLQAETGKYGYKAAGTKKVLIDQLVRVWKAIHPELFPVPEKPESVPPWRARSRSASPKVASSSSVKASIAQQNITVSDAEEDDSSSASSSEALSTKNRKSAASKRTAVKAKSSKSATSIKSKAIAAARAKRKASLSRSGGSDINDDPDDEETDLHANDAIGEDEIDTDTAPDELKTAGDRLRNAILNDEKFYMRILRYEPIQFDDFEMILAACEIKMSKVALRDWLDSQGIIFYYDQTTGRNAKRNGARRRHA